METMFNIIKYGKGPDKLLGIPPSSPNLNHLRYVKDWQKHIDNNSLFNFVSLKKIKPNTKYVVYLNHYHHFVTDKYQSIYKFYSQGQSSVNLLSNVTMSERMWNDSKNGLVHWIIDWGTECTQLERNSQMDFKKLCIALNAPPKNITLITGAETIEPYGNVTLKDSRNKGYNCITGFELFKFLALENQEEDHAEYVSTKIKDIINNNILTYKSLSYNRLPRAQRTMIVSHIIKNNYDKECLYSLGTFANGPRWHWTEHFPELKDQVDLLVNGPDIYPHIKEIKVNLQKNQANRLGWDHGLNSYFQLVTETTPDNARYPFITEKLLKPLAMLQPFIQSGPKDNIKVLKTHGFHTFDKWINHDYDNEEDDIQRLRLVLCEFDRLQNIPAPVWSKMLKEMLPSLLHNYQLIKKPVTRNITSQLIPILFNFMESD
jgi:hypothetical protein